MPRLDERTAWCFHMLRSQEFRPLLEYLRASQAEAVKKLTEVTDEKQLFRHQGEVRILNEFLNNVDRADELVQKLRANSQTVKPAR